MLETAKFINSTLDETNHTITLNFDSNIININDVINVHVEYCKIIFEISNTTDGIEIIINEIKKLSNYFNNTNNSIIIDYQAFKKIVLVHNHNHLYFIILNK